MSIFFVAGFIASSLEDKPSAAEMFILARQGVSLPIGSLPGQLLQPRTSRSRRSKPPSVIGLRLSMGR